MLNLEEYFKLGNIIHFVPIFLGQTFLNSVYRLVQFEPAVRSGGSTAFEII